MIETIDILGIIAFSISGVLAALHKKLDVFGVLIIAFVTATGGGTIRDLLIGHTPVTWMRDIKFSAIILGSTILGILFRHYLSYLRKSLFLFDTIGIGLYTVLGIETGISAGLSPLICIGLGVITATFGGVVRDILTNEIPVIFRKEIYATACIVGGVMYFLLLNLSVSRDYIFIISAISVILVRLAAIIFKISLPSLYKD